MRIFIDTEFLESGPAEPLHLFSIALVAEDGREFYAINRDCPLDLANAWVRANVLPHVDMDKAESREDLKARMIAFLADVCNDGVPPQFWGYYCDYDWVVFAQIFGTMMDLPENYPMFCYDMKQWAMMLGNPPLPQPDPSAEHHALNDARWIRSSFWYLQQMALRYVSAFANAMGTPLDITPTGGPSEPVSDDDLAAREA